MPECIKCGKYTKYKNGTCKVCYQKEKEPKPATTKKEEKARSKSTTKALKVHDALRDAGIKSLVEFWDGHKHIDIAIPEHKINIEIDGVQHNIKPKQALSDLKRTYHSYKKGYFTLRIPNSLINNHFNECINLILEMINS